MAQKIGILFSGGLESTSLLNHYKKLNYSINLIYLKSGYVWENTELNHAKKIAKFYNLSLTILDYSNTLNVDQLGEVNNLNDNIIPLRNLFLFTITSMYFYKLKVFNIAIGLQGNEEYPDNSFSYIQDCERLIKQGLLEDNFSIQIPFYGLSKEKIFRKNNEIPIELVFSCTSPINSKRCHECYKCEKLDKLLKKLDEV